MFTTKLPTAALMFQALSLPLPNRMVIDLIEEHAADWDVYLPAKVFSLCFKEHSTTKERPFSMLYCKGQEPVQSPQGLNVSVSFEHKMFYKPLFCLCSKMTLVVFTLSAVCLFQNPRKHFCGQIEF